MSEHMSDIIAFLREHFPEWNREDGGRTHVAAIACVGRIAHREGSVSAERDGPEIRAAVARFDERLGALQVRS